MNDPEGKHQMWLPVEWQGPYSSEGWSCKSEALQLSLEDEGTIIIKF